MIRPNLEGIQARLDATNDARTPANERELANLRVYANARRDLCLCLEYIRELEDRVADLRDRAARSESATAYSVIRPPNETMDLPKVLAEPAGLRPAPVPAPRYETVSKDDAVRVLSHLIAGLK